MRRRCRVGGTPHAQGLLEQRLRLVQPSLIAQHLCDVVSAGGGVDLVPDADAELAALVVQLNRLVPTSLPPREQAEVVVDRGLRPELAEFVVQLERLLRVHRFAPASELDQRPVEDEVGVGKGLALAARLAASMARSSQATASRRWPCAWRISPYDAMSRACCCAAAVSVRPARILASCHVAASAAPAGSCRSAPPARSA